MSIAKGSVKFSQGKRLGELMESAKVNVSQLSRITGVSRNTIDVKMRATAIGEKYVLLFSEALGVDPAFFSESESGSPETFQALSIGQARQKISDLESRLLECCQAREMLSEQLAINARYIVELESRSRPRPRQ